MPKLLLLALTALLAGCCTPPEPTVRIIDTACAWTKPIIISKQDILTDGTAQQIVAHNDTGRDRCGWKPPSKGAKK